MSEPIIKWSIFGDAPSREKFIGESKTLVWNISFGRRRQYKKGEYHFDTYAEARAALIAKAERNVATAEKNLADAQARLPKCRDRLAQKIALPTEEPQP